MVLPPRKRSGQPLRASELNAIRDAARIGSTTSTGRGLDVIRSGAGQAIAFTPTAEQVDNAVQAELTSATTDIIYGVVEIYEALEGYIGPVLTQCRVPSESGFGRLGILMQGTAENTVAWVQVRGISAIAYTGTVAVGGRLGGKQNAHMAQPDQGGPFLVLQLADETSTPKIAVVEITGRRLDAKMVDCDAVDATASGPYHTIIYRGRTVTEDSPGKLTTS